MAGLVLACPGHPRLSLPPRARKQDVDARDKRGHDDGEADSICAKIAVGADALFRLDEASKFDSRRSILRVGHVYSL
jgi:hypothetical protein